MWNVLDRGFLPLSDPINTLPIGDIRNTELIYTWENLSSVVPYFLKEECLREEMIHSLRVASHSYYHGFMDNLGGAGSYERAFLLLAYFSTAYINSAEGKPKSKLPKELTVPFARIAHLVGRQPVLDYTSYVLYNWRLKNKDKNIVKNNVEILHTFTDSLSEQALLSAFIEMEARGAELAKQLVNPCTVVEILFKINELLQETKASLECDFADFWNGIVADYKNLRYEQWRQDELTFPCDIFLQSPLLHTIYKYLDINFQNGCLVKRKEEIRNFHMPASHRDFICSVNGIRNKCSEDDNFKEVYNNCLTQLIELRKNLAFREVDKSEMANEELTTYYFK